MSTLITLVEPGRFTAVPAVVTIRSPDSITPEPSADSIARVQRSSTFSIYTISTGTTPHSSDICCTEI